MVFSLLINVCHQRIGLKYSPVPGLFLVGLSHKEIGALPQTQIFLSYFLSLQPDFVNLWYFKLRFLILTEFKVYDKDIGIKKLEFG